MKHRGPLAGTAIQSDHGWCRSSARHRGGRRRRGDRDLAPHPL